MPALDTAPTTRRAPMIDGELRCWRCDDPTDAEGFCRGCGAVTIPVANAGERDTNSSSSAAVGFAPALQLEPLPTLDALDLGMAAGELRG